MNSALAFLTKGEHADATTSPYYAQAHSFIEGKLWHQLCDTLTALYKEPTMHMDHPHMLAVYVNVIVPLAKHLSPLARTTFCVTVAGRMEDFPQADALLTATQDDLGNDCSESCACLLLSTRAALALRHNDVKSAGSFLGLALARLREAQASLHGVEDESVPAAYYRALSQLYRAKGQAKRFYDAALKYLAHESLDRLSQAEQRDLAVDLGVAALAGDEIYNFGDLLQHPIYAQLATSWLGHLLAAVNIGDISGYQAVLRDNKADVEKHAALVTAAQTLREKVSILALMTLALSRSSRDRTLGFGEIAKATHLDETEVELLLMKALSLGLVRGAIDQVERTVVIDWVQPRVLDASQLDVLALRLEEWSKLVSGQLATLSKQVPAGSFD